MMRANAKASANTKHAQDCAHGGPPSAPLERMHRTQAVVPAVIPQAM